MNLPQFHVKNPTIKRYYLAIAIVIIIGLTFAGLKIMSKKNQDKIYYPDGIIAYQGNLKDGDLSVIEDWDGIISNSIPEGFGKKYYIYKTLWYEGDWAEDQNTGNGKLFFANGVIEYEGAWLTGLYQGEGSLYREDGTIIYKGSFDKGLYHGIGQLYDEGGLLIYEGQWQNGEMLPQSEAGTVNSD